MTEKNILEGIKATLENSEALYDDAMLLKNNGRKERAYLLFQISIEETGKAFALFHILLTEEFKNQLQLKQFLKDFKDHKFKIKSAINIDTIIARIIIDNELRKAVLKFFLEQHEKISHFNDMKNFSLYVSYFQNQFISPNQFIKTNNLDTIEFLAMSRLTVTKQFIPLFLENLSTLRPLFKQAISNMTNEKIDKLGRELWNGKSK